MNNKGFTLIELLAVIALLGVIVGLAVPGIMAVVNAINSNMLDKKLEIIEEAAILYGNDNKNDIINSSSKYNYLPCKSIIVSELIPDYLDKDKDNCNINECIVDPSNENKYLDPLEVIIYYKNKRIYAKVDIKNNLSCE